MIDSNTFCPFCMKPLSGDVGKDESGHCISCGKNVAAYIPSSHHLRVGTILRDRYLLGCVLGEGGYGITYIGFDSVLQNRVAVKEYFPVEFCTRDIIGGNSVNVLSGIPAKNYARGMQKYLTEARLLAKMEKQEVIVNVRDYFEDNRTAYIVMEYIEGITFTEFVNENGGHIPEDVLFHLVEPLFGALCSLHQYGLIHRDMCPDNLMLESVSDSSDWKVQCPASCKISEMSSSYQRKKVSKRQVNMQFQTDSKIQQENRNVKTSGAYCSEMSLDCKESLEEMTVGIKVKNTGKDSVDVQEKKEVSGDCVYSKCCNDNKRYRLDNVGSRENIIDTEIDKENDERIRGRVRLLDFGSARSSDSLKDTLTITLRHGFAPIEQYQQGGGQGSWTDVYALCATLYFCLTGMTPPVATNRIIEDSLVPPSRLGIKISPSRENALMRGLRVQPHRRCRTIRDLWSAFYR